METYISVNMAPKPVL